MDDSRYTFFGKATQDGEDAQTECLRIVQRVFGFDFETATNLRKEFLCRVIGCPVTTHDIELLMLAAVWAERETIKAEISARMANRHRMFV